MDKIDDEMSLYNIKCAVKHDLERVKQIDSPEETLECQSEMLEEVLQKVHSFVSNIKLSDLKKE